jgi:hypothetical protein
MEPLSLCDDVVIVSNNVTEYLRFESRQWLFLSICTLQNKYALLLSAFEGKKRHELIF